MKDRYELARDESPDGEEFGGWKVTRFHRHGWQVVYRGDMAAARGADEIERLTSAFDDCAENANHWRAEAERLRAGEADLRHALAYVKAERDHWHGLVPRADRVQFPFTHEQERGR